MAETKTVGIREFKAKATQIVREVREQGTEYTVTVDGTPSARLTPVPVEETREARIERQLKWLEEWRALGREISKHWPEGVSAADAIAEQRR